MCPLLNDFLTPTLVENYNACDDHFSFSQLESYKFCIFFQLFLLWKSKAVESAKKNVFFGWEIVCIKNP